MGFILNTGYPSLQRSLHRKTKRGTFDLSFLIKSKSHSSKVTLQNHYMAAGVLFASK